MGGLEVAVVSKMKYLEEVMPELIRGMKRRQ